MLDRDLQDRNVLIEIEPALETAYAEHMDAIINKRPLRPTATLAQVARTEKIDPLEYGPVFREEHILHLESTGESLGVDIRPVLAASFLVNLLTEDNLPHYTSRIQDVVRLSPALLNFSKEWTAEEDAHGVLMRDYALLSGIIGNNASNVIATSDYESGRINQLQSGTEIKPRNLQNAFAYLALQEHLTKEAHNKLSWLLAPGGRKIMRPISGDEQNHYEYYLKALTAVLEADPDGTIIEINQVFQSFSMPGRIGIPSFDTHALTIGTSGIFDLESIANSKQTVVEKLALQSYNPVSDDAKQAQELLIKSTSDRAIRRQRRIMDGIRDEVLNNHKPSDLLPFILNRTVEFEYAGAPGYERPIGLQAIKL